MVGVLAAAVATASPVTATDPGDYGPVATVPFYEGSGIVASRSHAGVFWALADSGGPERTVLHAFKIENGRLAELRGDRFRTVRVEGTTNTDWEALTTDDRGNLWIGDIGNNGCRRDDLEVHRLPEPDPYSDSRVRIAATYPVAWPDAPRGGCTGHDAESMFVLGDAPYVIAKTSPRPGVYRVPTEVTTSRNRLDKVGELTPPPGRSGAPPTDAAVSTDGARLVVANGNKQTFVYAANDPSSREESAVRDLVDDPPRWIQDYRADERRLAVEGAAFDAGGYDVVLLSESRELLYFPRAFYES